MPDALKHREIHVSEHAYAIVKLAKDPGYYARFAGFNGPVDIIAAEKDCAFRFENCQEAADYMAREFPGVPITIIEVVTTLTTRLYHLNCCSVNETGA